MNTTNKTLRWAITVPFFAALACASVQTPTAMKMYEKQHSAEENEIVRERYPKLVEKAELHYKKAKVAQEDKEQEELEHHAQVAMQWWQAAATRSRADDMVTERKQILTELEDVKKDLAAAQKQKRLAKSALDRAKQVIALQGQVADSEGNNKARDAINEALAVLTQAEQVDAKIHAKSKFQEAESKLEAATSALKNRKPKKAQTLAQEAEAAAASAKAEAKPKYASTQADRQRTKHQRELFETLSKISGVKASIVQGGVQITLAGSFEHNGVEIKPTMEGAYKQIAKVAKRYKDISLVIEGHTDSKGRDSKNLQLSDSRAKSVMSFLASHGVEPNRMSALGKGSGEPVANNRTQEGRAQNRRIEILFSTPGV